MDFELSAHNGVLGIFPNSQIKCCRFHLGQDCFSLDWLFYILMKFLIAPNNFKISEFSNYILANFIENDSRYPPHLWAEPPSNEPRTTNGPESYHRHLKD
ncbi:hypothetical protein QTP88_002003 [Uroleucon formosanum]